MSASLDAPSDFAPKWAVPPGALIRRELEAGGFSQADVALRTNLSAKHLNQVLQGHVPLSPEVALALERVLGPSADLWLRMDVSWQAHKARAVAQNALAAVAGWVRNFPSPILKSKNIVDFSASSNDQVDALLRFFRVTDTQAFDRVWLDPQAAYKRSQKFDIDRYATALWLRLAESTAEAMSDNAPEYDAALLRHIVQSLPQLTALPVAEGFRRAEKELAKAGVLLVFLPEIEGTRICGASRWLGNGRPVIALSGRHRFHDVFWFTLLHEIGHVLLHPKRATYLEVERKGKEAADDESIEAAANEFAANALLTPIQREELLSIETPEALIEFSDRLSLGVSVVAGQYAHITHDWHRFGKLRVSSDIAADLAA